MYNFWREKGPTRERQMTTTKKDIEKQKAHFFLFFLPNLDLGNNNDDDNTTNNKKQTNKHRWRKRASLPLPSARSLSSRCSPSQTTSSSTFRESVWFFEGNGNIEKTQILILVSTPPFLTLKKNKKTLLPGCSASSTSRSTPSPCSTSCSSSCRRT